jgi:hypothetical protein
MRKKTYSFYLRDREDAVEVEGAKLDDNGTRVTVTDDENRVVAVFVWSEMQGYSTED